MLKKSGLIGAMLLAASSFAWAGELVGQYDVSGANPGGRGKYSGSVTVEQTGQTFRVTWDIGNQTYVGTGVGNAKGFAVSYRSGNMTGLAIYGANGNNWEGVWTYAGGKDIGTEVWTRK